MRILSARVSRVHHNRTTGKVDAVVTLLIREPARSDDYRVIVRTSAAVHAPGGAALRDRLAASAKLIFSTCPDIRHPQSFAA